MEISSKIQNSEKKNQNFSQELEIKKKQRNLRFQIKIFNITKKNPKLQISKILKNIKISKKNTKFQRKLKILEIGKIKKKIIEVSKKVKISKKFKNVQKCQKFFKIFNKKSSKELKFQNN